MRQRKTISEGEIQQALAKFLRQGGLIKRLPDQVAPRNLMVGGRWGMYEPVMETSSVGSNSSA